MNFLSIWLLKVTNMSRSCLITSLVLHASFWFLTERKAKDQNDVMEIFTIILQGAEVPFYIWYDDYPEHASQEYKGRVSKVPPDGQGQSGLASLILSEVKDTDRGWYNCKVLFLNREPNNAVVSA